MRCKQCQYWLWGVRVRQCPECGAAFYPSQFEFTPGTVKFCCPHCDQDYYGTSECGLLVPEQFDCVRCGQPIRMDDMVLFPGDGLREEQTGVERFAWLDRRKVGLIRAWLRTVMMGMFMPTRTMQLTANQPSLGQAWWFATVTATLATVLGMSLFMLLVWIGSGGRGSAPLVAVATVGIAGLIWPTVVVAVWGGLTHGVLGLLGGTSRGPSRTCEAICYSSSATILLAVPCLGFYLAPVAWIWWMIAAILMVREGQRTNGIRATVAVGTLPLLLLCGFVAIFTYLLLPQYRSMQTFLQQNQAVVAQQANLSLVAARVIQDVQTNGRPPAHAFALIAGGVPASAFVRQNRPGDLYDTVIAQTSINSFSKLDPKQQAARLQEIEAAMPEKPIAHRVGDFVFTYHGIDFSNPDPNLWIVILIPHPGDRMPSFEVVLANGSTRTIFQALLPQDLAVQNKLRATHGLPPLPDPTRVKSVVPVPTASGADKPGPTNR